MQASGVGERQFGVVVRPAHLGMQAGFRQLRAQSGDRRAQLM
ncbi:hypothetical protein [Microtetraspora sp. NBRC 13810]|nr:hypothetical protein [Microtetraspora sp. NBRC 13810]